MFGWFDSPQETAEQQAREEAEELDFGGRDGFEEILLPNGAAVGEKDTPVGGGVHGGSMAGPEAGAGWAAGAGVGGGNADLASIMGAVGNYGE